MTHIEYVPLCPRRIGMSRLRSAKLCNVGLILMLILGCAKESPQNQLSAAIVYGDVQRVEALLDDPAVDINWLYGREGTALTAAAGFNRIEIAKLLLSRGADPNTATTENATAIGMAAYKGNVEMVQLLIEAGADVNVVESRFGFTPLENAAWKGHAKIVRLLLEAGADFTLRDKRGRTAAQMAQQHGHEDVARLIDSFAVNGVLPPEK